MPDIVNVGKEYAANTLVAGPTSGADGLLSARVLVGADLPINIVTNSKIADGAVDTDKIADNAVTGGSGVGAKITGGTITGANMAAGSINLASSVVTGVTPVTNGGTGIATVGASTYGIVAAGTTATGAFQVVAPGTSGYVLTSTGTTSLPTWQAAGGGGSVSSVTGTAGRVIASPTTGAVVLDLASTGVGAASYTLANLTVDGFGRLTSCANGTVNLATQVTGELVVGYGGTGNNTFTTGAIVVGNGTGPLIELTPTTNNRVVRCNGTSFSLSQLNVTTDVTGTLPIASGGTGVATTTAYAVLCGGTTSTNPLQPIASVGTAGQVLTSNGPGTLPTMQTPASPTATFPYNYCLNSQFEFNDYQTSDTLSKTITRTTSHAPSAGPGSLTYPGANYMSTRWWLQPQTNGVACARASIPIGTSGVSAAYGITLSPNATGKLIFGQILNSADTLLLQGKTLRCGVRLVASGYTGVVKVGLFKWSSTVNTITDAIWSAAGANGVDPTWATNLTLISTAGTITASTSYQELYNTFVVPTSGCNNLALIVWTDSQLTNVQTLTVTQGMIQDSGATSWNSRNSADERRLCDFFSRRWQLNPAQTNALETGLIGQAVSTTSATGFTFYHPGMNLNYNSGTSYNNAHTAGNTMMQLVNGVTSTATTSLADPTIIANSDQTILVPTVAAGLVTGTTYRLQTTNSQTFYFCRFKEL